MKPSARPIRIGLVLLAVGALAAACMGGTFAAFTSTASSPGNAITAANDFRAPVVSSGVIARSTTAAAPGFVRQGGTYTIYAQVAADTGNPASGILAVTANVGNVTTGLTAVPLVAGSYTVSGTSYNYASATLTANAVLSEGSKSYSITASDVATNSAMSGLSVTVDNTAPSASDVQGSNTGGGILGRAQLGDTLVLTFSEPIDPATVLAGWTGAATNVVVRLTDGGLQGLGGNDDVQIRNAANSVALPLGVVDLQRSDYADSTLGGRVDFGASGTASTMSLSGSTVTITLGNPVPVGLGAGATTAGATGAMIWSPQATPTDRAGNLTSTAPATESGTADKEF